MASDTESIYDLPLDTQDLDEYIDGTITKPGELREYQPSILFESISDTSTEIRQLSGSIHQEANAILPILLNNTELKDSLREILTDAAYCELRDGSEDYWSFIVIWPILQLAREICGLKHEVRIVPLRTTKIGSESLLPQLRTTGEPIDKRVDFGIILNLDGDQTYQIERLDQSNCTKQALHGIGPSASLALQNSPLFCCIEVKKPEHRENPLVQLGVWTSAVYSRWEAVRALQDLPLRDFPILFGWTIEGHIWTLYIISRRSDGSRWFTRSKSYNTAFIEDINLITATLCHLLDRGNNEFRQSFLTSVLDVPVSTSTSTPAPVLNRASASPAALNKHSASNTALTFSKIVLIAFSAFMALVPPLVLGLALARFSSPSGR